MPPRPSLSRAAGALLLALGACAPLPEVDPGFARPEQPAAAPRLLPLDEILTEVEADPDTEVAADALARRGAALRQRAEALRQRPGPD